MNRSRLLLLSLAPVLMLAACREPNAPAPEPAAPAAATEAAPVAAAAATPSPIASGAETYAEGAKFIPGTLCNIEYLGTVAFGAEPVLLDAPQSLRGWLGDEQGATPRDVELRFVDDADNVMARVPLQLGGSREDVAAAFPGKAGLANGGFNQALSPAGLPAGTWRVHLVYTAGEGAGARAVSCDNGRRVTVAPAA
ncbi:hypothetical protein [Arenimonas sp. MALMAid1274]|uniref:hypothetical protein n=1 Tax=Arenimonas sp. MALMAid1274 TaxID=3411630 RepID=UPI003BA222A5